jgi:hypothetical protein
MDWEIFQPRVDDKTESQSEKAEKQSDQQQIVPIHSSPKSDAGKIGQFKIGFAAGLFRLSQSGRRSNGKKKKKGCCRLSNAVRFRRNPVQADAHGNSSDF